MSQATQPDHDLAKQQERIVEELEGLRESLERIAATDTALADRAESALEWLDEHQEDDDE